MPRMYKQRELQYIDDITQCAVGTDAPRSNTEHPNGALDIAHLHVLVFT